MQITVARTAEIAGMPVATLRSWFQRELIPAAKDQVAPEYWGDTRLLGPHTVLGVAIAVALTRLNVSPAVATSAAFAFAHTSQGTPRRAWPGALYRDGRRQVRAGWAAEGGPPPVEPETEAERHDRLHTESFLRVDVHGQGVIFAIGKRSSMADVLVQIARKDGAIILHLDPIVEHVRKELSR